MSKENDSKIIELKNQIEVKKSILGENKRFTPITNCIIELEGNTYNIQTLNKDQLTILLVRLNMYRISAIDLDITNKEFIISGFSIGDWMEDIRNKLFIMNRKAEERKLKAMEEKLDKLLSNDKKIELEILEIENLIKNNQ